MTRADRIVMRISTRDTGLSPSTFNGGFGAIGTAVHLVVPASLLVLVGDLCRLARRGLLARRQFRSLASQVAGGEGLGVRPISLVRPSAIVLNNFICNRAHCGPPISTYPILTPLEFAAFDGSVAFARPSSACS